MSKKIGQESEINAKLLAPDGIVAINKDEKIIVFDEAASRITGLKADEVISKKSSYLFLNEEERSLYLKDSISTGKIFTNISLTVNSSKNGLNVTASITPLIQPSQKIIGLVVVFRNTEETLSLYNALEEKNKEIIEEKNKLETIFNSLLEGTFTINSEWEITSFNYSAEKITGFIINEAIGKKYWEVLPSEDGKEDMQLREFIANHSPSLLRETIIIRKTGERVPVRINSAPLMDISGNKIIGRVVTFEDISVLTNLSGHIEERFHFKNVIGRSKSMQTVFNMMENVITTDSTVLITGESGTGKEVIARAIHLYSDRKSEPFIAVNCTAFAESLLESELFGHEKGAFTGAIRTKPGRFELAGNGTLFLDEIGDIPLPVQVKLLRVLENRQFERVGGTKTIELKARIVTATHRNLEKEIEKGRFREDLFYRINVINIHLPALIERNEDIPTLVNHFMNKFRDRFKKDIHYISPNALKILTNYRWPGNIRELENVLEHAFVVCNSDAIKTEHLPDRLKTLKEEIALNEKNISENPFEVAEKQLLVETLKKFNGDRTKTASALGINKTTLWRKMKKLHLIK